MKATVIKLFADDVTGLLHYPGEVLFDAEAYVEKGLAVATEKDPTPIKEEVAVEETVKVKKVTGRKKKED